MIGVRAFDGIGRNPCVGIEAVLAAVAFGFAQVGGEQLLVHAAVVIDLPVPVGWVPRQCRQRDVDRADLELAAVFGRLGA
jgi:hypothetical protein